mmetsp:Transcript_61620/g.145651  ORF Transcript_61620/g.145651 Transcript_61620/m.145651 type:complete len:80 (+) Transcript_61620:249-488(+)
MWVTFLFSAVLHELVMIVVCKKLRMYLLALQLFQLPLMYIGRLGIIRRHPRLGNCIFWIGLIIGPPGLCIAYLRDIALA